MNRSSSRILTTHTGSLPRTQKVVDLLMAERKEPGKHKAALNAAVREAIAGVVQKQVNAASTSSMTANRAAPITPCMCWIA